MADVRFDLPDRGWGCFPWLAATRIYGARYTSGTHKGLLVGHAPGVLLGGAPAGALSLPALYLGERGLSICNILSRITPVVKSIRLIYRKLVLTMLVTLSSDSLNLEQDVGILSLPCAHLGRHKLAPRQAAYFFGRGGGREEHGRALLLVWMLRQSLSHLNTIPPVSVHSCTL
jgi:hypothetical protein